CQCSRKGGRLATLTGGDFVGEIALVTELPRTATVTAETPVRLFVLTTREFHAVLDRNPKVERKVLRALARRLAETASDRTLASRGRSLFPGIVDFRRLRWAAFGRWRLVSIRWCGR